jgi:trehalose 6-phosphate phosphatase
MPGAQPQPSTPEGAAGLAALLSDPSRAVVAVDFDGTLAPIVERPEDARPAAGALEALARLATVVDSVVVITGRAATTAVALGGLDRAEGLAGLVVLGQYGAERWDAATGRFVEARPPAGLEQARDELSAIVSGSDVPNGVEIEDKGIALGIHVRRTPDPEAVLALLRPRLEALAERHGLVVEPGRMVLELRAPGVDKGWALTGFVHERAARVVVYAGDDLGDLAAFAAVRALRDEGVSGLTVCAESHEVSALSERADLVVDGPEGVVALLARLADMITKD